MKMYADNAVMQRRMKINIHPNHLRHDAVWLEPLHSGAETGDAGDASATPKVLIYRKFGQNLKQFEQKFRHFSNILMKLYFFINECITISLLCDRNYVKCI